MAGVAIQGDPGAFSHMAAQQLLGADVELLPCRTFPEAFEAVTSARASRAVIPVENSLAGPVVESLDLLWQTGLRAYAETHVRVELCLVVAPGTTMDTIERVASHPVALRQCRGLFTINPALEEVVVYDTAGSVRELTSGEADYDAAIGSALAARIYGAEILKSGVEDDPLNYTRFFELGRPSEAARSRGASAAAAIVIPNRPGALHEVLGTVANTGVDLTQIVARPIPGEPWHYRFHIDLRGPTEDHTTAALDALAEVVTEIRLYGSYSLIKGFKPRSRSRRLKSASSEEITASRSDSA